MDLQWLDKDDKFVLASTKKAGVDQGGLWQSTDGAKTWVEKTAALTSSINGSESIDIMWVQSQKSSPQNVAIFGTGTYYWISHDYGATFAAKRTPGLWKGSGIKSLKMHPRKDGWLLVLVKRPSCKSLDHAQMECPHDLMLTQDLFGSSSWKNLTADTNGRIAAFVDFDWGANLCPNGAGTCPDAALTADETIFATMYEHPGDYDQPWDPDVHFVVSSNWFSDYSMHVRCGNMFELVGHSVYLAFANSCPTDINGKGRGQASDFPKGISLYTSIDAANSFVQACLPVALKQEGYELMETHDGSGALIVVDFVINNGMMDIPASSVYSAGPHHALFSLSLTDVYHADFGFSTDFAKIEGLPGIYIANQMLARIEATSLPYESNDYYDLSDSTGAPLVETRITFNGGGKWQRIPAPSSFNFPRCNRCDGQSECYLHLHGMSSWDSMAMSLPAVYSNPSAPGLIMATGNVGPKGVGLDDNDGLCTWLSTDGGVTWSDVGVDAWIYEYADWGGVIVMARHPGVTGAPADEILFSVDGKCWQRVGLTTALLVDNIRIEPDGQRPRVVVHGRACRKGLNAKCSYAEDDTRGLSEGLMYTLDVKELMNLGMCTYKDYEDWTVPTDVHNGSPRCVLGEQLTLKRRAADRVCLNGGDWKRPAMIRVPCNCTGDDMECDYGFLRSGPDCVPIPGDRMPHCPVVEDHQYSVSATGKRLLHGDVCTNVNGVIPDTDGKGSKTNGGGSSDSGGGGGGSGGSKKKHSAWFGFFMFLLVVAVLSGMFVGWWRFLATESHRDSVRDIANTVVSFCASLYGWAVDKIRGRAPGSFQAEQDLGYFQPLGDAGVHDADERGGIFTLK